MTLREFSLKEKVAARIKRFWASLNGAFLFYTCWPLPAQWPTHFASVARFAPVVGLVLGAIMAAEYEILRWFQMPLAVSSTGVILTGLWLTGGLHFDGAMDTADGLAVQDDQKRLQVMADSRSGAFGVMVAIAILLLKITALATLDQSPWYALMMAAGWGRWGQQWAIARYPYLKLKGKGAFHKQAFRSGWDTLPSALLLMGLSLVFWGMGWISWPVMVVATTAGVGGAIVLAHWLNHKLGGHTGDTYGAVVEWVEVMVLVGLSSQ